MKAQENVTYDVAAAQFTESNKLIGQIQSVIDTGKWDNGSEYVPHRCNRSNGIYGHYWFLHQVTGYDGDLATDSKAVMAELTHLGFDPWIRHEENGATISGKRADGAEATVNFWLYPDKDQSTVAVYLNTQCYPGDGDWLSDYLDKHGILDSQPDYSLPGTDHYREK